MALNLIFGQSVDVEFGVRYMEDRDDEISYVNVCGEAEEAFGGEHPCQQSEMGACTCSGKTCRSVYLKQWMMRERCCDFQTEKFCLFPCLRSVHGVLQAEAPERESPS